jgi:aminopeptidase N
MLENRHFHCRRCQTLQTRKAGGRTSFFVPGSTKHYAPDLPLRLEHIKIEVEVDPRVKGVKATTTQRVRVIAANQTWMKLDQIGLEIHEVKVAGKPAEFAVEGNSLRVRIGTETQTFKPGEAFEFSIRHEARDPKRGMYFTGPDKDYPDKPYQVWVQGQDEDNRHWFPTFDYPNQKATSEVIATVPTGFTAVSNGALLSKKAEGGKTVFHYRLGTPHVTYLITLAVGEFVEWADKGPHDLPVQYFVAPGREEDGRRAFSNTPKMIAAYESKIGVPYAYEKYSQVAVQDFIFGGMENTSATTQTDLTLHDGRAHLDFRSDGLVSHELAHQWFGDLLTCRDWSHGWLNEGFATFMERVWVENNPTDFGGADEAKYYQYQDLKEYLAEDSGSYRRPVVCNTYLEPIDLFDAHLYQKGGLILNLIRATLGEEQFWEAVKLYVSRHKGGSVETLDLIRAIEDATGRNLRRFFDEWIFGAGYPEFELSYQWHEDKKFAELVIEQKQTGGESSVTKDGATTHLFHLSPLIELTLEGGKKVSRRIEIGEARDRVFLPAESKPLMVRFDVGGTIPKALKFPRPKEMLIYQLKNDTDSLGRIEAAQELSKIQEADVQAALAEAVKSDPFWGVQAEVAQVLADRRTPEARDALVAALTVKNPRARRAIVKALGKFKDVQATDALAKLMDRDESYFVEGEATLAWTVSQLRPGCEKEDYWDHVVRRLIGHLEKESYREVIRVSTLNALAELPGIGREERPLALATLMEWTRRGRPGDARMAAIMALGRVARAATGSERARVLELFSQLAEEPNFRVRMALIIALESTEAPDAIAIAERVRSLDLDGRVRRHAMGAIGSLREAGTTPESVATLKASFDKLEEEHRKLKAMVEEIKGGKA